MNSLWILIYNVGLSVGMVWVLFNYIENAFLIGCIIMSEFLKEDWVRLMMSFSWLMFDFGVINMELNGCVFGFGD